jgi:glycosyltransferase involved in cell wall biosynthesis
MVEQPLMRILHMIPDLEVGGAETSLLRLLGHLQEDSVVVCLKDAGYLAAEVEATGARVVSLGMRAGRPGGAGVARLLSLANATAPDVVHAWMYHAGVLSAALRPLRRPIVWSLHHAAYRSADHRMATNVTVRVAAGLSRAVPRAIIFPSQRGLAAHVGAGYPSGRSRVIPNGVSRGLGHDDAGAARVRAELGISPDAPVIGNIGRYTPEKDHAAFLEAAQQVAARLPTAHVVLAGRGVDATNEELTRRVADSLRSRVHLLGHRHDVDALLASLDVLVVSSRTESLPNVMIEGLACGVPVVSTDVGDARLVIGPAGVVVDGGTRQLVAAIVDVLGWDPSSRAGRTAVGRRHIQDHFSVEAMADAHLDLYREVVGLPA